MLAEFRSPTTSSQRTTDGDFLTFSPSLNPSIPPSLPNTLLSAPASIPRSPDWASLAPNSSGQLWAWSPLPPRGPSRYCQSERWARRTSHHGEDQFGGDTRCRLGKRGALRPRDSGGLQQRAGRGEVGGGVGGWEPFGTLVASETESAITTEMASQSQGIQQLLQAEKRAAEKVADARKRKARRLKQAKEEAQMEVEQYRRERELEFQSKQQAAMGSQGNLSAEVEQATRCQVQGMQSSQQKNRERVLAQLLGMVCDVRPQVHPNYRIAA